jgi:hypothetical protein
MMFERSGHFIGKRNRTKAKVWLWLEYLADNGYGGATINQIHQATGVSLLTLRRSMDKWWSWGRIHKKLLRYPLSDGSTCIYSISATGRKYLNEVVPVHFYNDCVDEIQKWQEERHRIKSS